jgi:hypothetical protein
MLALALVAVVSLSVNLVLARELRRLARRTKRLAVLARAEARHVRAIDWATAAAFDRVHALLDGRSDPPEREPERPSRPVYPN